jgi:hypothetical protein
MERLDSTLSEGDDRGNRGARATSFAFNDLRQESYG